jgi:hypothetical protein
MKFGRMVLLVSALLTGPVAAQAQTTYTVAFNGGTIDLFGTIQVSAFGLFNGSIVGANVVDYSITASNNGAAAFTFTMANSFWGGSGVGTALTFEATATSLSITSLFGVNSSVNRFLTANAATNGAIENLRLNSDGDLGYRTPSPPDVLLTEQVGTTFVLGTAPVAVPEPTSLALVLTGVVGVAGAVLRRRAA